MSDTLQIIQAAVSFPDGLKPSVLGSVPMLAPLRSFRDHQLDDLAELDSGSDDPGWLEQIVMRDGGFDEAFAYFESNQFSGLCEKLDEFDACCALVAEIEHHEWQRQKARGA